MNNKLLSAPVVLDIFAPRTPRTSHIAIVTRRQCLEAIFSIDVVGEMQNFTQHCLSMEMPSRNFTFLRAALLGALGLLMLRSACSPIVRTQNS